MMTIGQRINKLRLDKGFTLQQLADEADISIHTINHWIYHGSHPDIFLLWSVADVFGVTLDELVGR